MTGFDAVAVVDWSASSTRSPARPSKDAIWMGLARQGRPDPPRYFRSRAEAEAGIGALIDDVAADGRRLLLCFDFPFGYPAGFARMLTGTADPFAVWDWLSARITDDDANRNNRFEVAAEINRAFDGPGPFWGKTHADRWPDIPYRKAGIVYDRVPERRACDLLSKASSSVFQLCYNPTVGSQALMGLPVLNRLRRRPGVAVWPFQEIAGAKVVLAEIWPGLIEAAVKADGPDLIRDAVQVTRLATALSRLPGAELDGWMRDLPDAAREEAWILGAGHAARLCDLAGGPLVAAVAAACKSPAGRGAGASADPVEAAPPLVPPPLRNDCFALPAGVDWTPVDDALARLRDGLAPVAAVETVPLAQALGRVLVRDLAAARAHPPMANSAVDGYGFAGGRPAGDHRLPLAPGRAAAGGAAPPPLPPGAALRVLTGAALPDGVDTVILEEDVAGDGAGIAFRGPVRPGANTRAAGEDVVAGATILHAGRVLTPADLALAAATGTGRLAVRARLRVGVLSTGDELAEPGAPAAPDRVFDANRPMLLGLVARFGHAPVDLGRAPDDRAALRARLDAAVADGVQAIVTSGGASAGDEDHVSALLAESGGLQEWRIAVKPGRPLALGLWAGAPVFGLPGNPVAAMVCTLIFARPALAVLAGQAWPEPQGFDVPAGFEKRKKPGRREYLRARIRDGRAEVFASEGSGRISGLSWAEGLVELGDGAAHVRPGDPVRYLPYAGFGI